MTRASSPGEHGRVAGRLAGELGRDTSQLARRARPCRRRARPRHEPARPVSTTVSTVDSPASSTVSPVDSPASSAVTQASSPGELDRGTDQLARRARPILRGPFRTQSHPITMHLRPKFP
ncbi:hypothetical protein F2Q70_00026931 [Brassica cretica]|uniref:Uncharacterized protein n=1 Tax=Brassica cretica TaxID=69181 RepID=A0A8S9LAU1_BRACR|nr:hypothetical protein F2Q70_00026931 [Brassica cretica]